MQTDNNLPQKVIGYILLSPALISVVLFFYDLFIGSLQLFNSLHVDWAGDYRFSGGGGAGYTSALPFYFGLMAIAGAYLIKDSKK